MFVKVTFLIEYSYLNWSNIRAQYIFLRAYKDVQKEKTAIDYLCLRRLDHWKGETHR